MVGIISLRAGTPFVPSIPSFATAFGITSNAIYDDFLSTSSIDLNNTLTGGFNWWLSNWPTDLGSTGPGASDPSWFSAASSILTISSNHATFQGGEMMSWGYLGGSNPRTISNLPLISGAKPFYIEIKMKSAVTGDLCPDFWMQDLTGTLTQIDNVNPAQRFAEIDIYEFGTAQISQTIHNWTTTKGVQNGNQSANVDLSGWDATIYHTFGVMVVPIAYNGGTTGFCRWYADRVQSVADATWTAGDAQYSSVESSNFAIMLGTDVSHNYFIDYISCWVHP